MSHDRRHGAFDHPATVSFVDEKNRVVKDLLPRYGELKKITAVR